MRRGQLSSSLKCGTPHCSPPPRHPVAGSSDAQQGPGDHPLLLDHQDPLHDGWGDRGRPDERRTRLGSHQHDLHHDRRSDRGPHRPIQDEEIHTWDLLARGRPDQHRRHPDHRQPGRQRRSRPADDDDRLQHRPRTRIRGLVLERADPIRPHHRDHQARGLLLVGDPLHLRPRHLRGGPVRREARTRLPALGRDLRRGNCDHRGRPPPLQAERDPRLLARLHPHPPPRRLDRRLSLPAG